MSYRILLVEDEAAIADSVAFSLQNEGFDVKVAYDGLEGLEMFKSFSPDLIVLDLMMPKMNGLDLCRIVRKDSQIPIIMLTAKSEEIDKIIGLELGADDYVAKPFSIRELVARIRAIFRRKDTTVEQAALRADDLVLDTVRRIVTVDGETIHLPLKQFELLRVLIMNAEKVIPREELFAAVWGEDVSYDRGTLDVHIRWLREKVEKDPSKPRYIKTIRGIGYRLVKSTDT